MVEFDLFEDLMVNWKSIMILQKESAMTMFDNGELLSYSFCIDPLRFWAVISAPTESALLQIVNKFPLASYLDFDYCQLSFHNATDPVPSISLN